MTQSTGLTERSQLVVTGSSAGGIEALSRVLGALTPDFAAPVVVAQHLDPRVPSGLATILSKHTRLHVVAVTDSAQLRPATVYVVPADRHVEITDGSVAVHIDGAGRPKPSIDLLFSSAAEIYGDRLIAVVLTGLGSDGSSGARAVKLHGGTVIIEDPQTANFPSMPASLEPAIVDIVAPLERIGAALNRIVGGSVELPNDPSGVRTLLAKVRSATGIDFSHYKLPTIERRLARQIAVSGRDDLTDYLAYLDAEPAEFGRLVANFLIRVTRFFRDSEMFEFLRSTIVPELIAKARERGRRELRLWSAGCSTGEEAYSLAILVAEALREESATFNVRIFATDVDDDAIGYARRGMYSFESVAELEPSLLDRYFTRTDDGYEVSKSIRGMTVFGQHDLGQRPPFPRIDLALCRNVLIYFSKDLQQRTLQVFAFSIRDGGYLALGKAESTAGVSHYFTAADAKLRVFRRTGERTSIPPAQIEKPPRRIGRDERPAADIVAEDARNRNDRLSLSEKLGAFLMGSPIGVVAVDRRYDLVNVNPAAREMFDIHGVGIGEDFVHMLPPPAAAHVRALLDGALRNERRAAGGEEVKLPGDDDAEQRYLTIAAYPEHGENANEVTGAVLLAVDISELGRARHELERLAELQTRDLLALRQAEAHARERQRSLTDANKQLAGANAELRAQNDALIINAEEAEAATEEVETLNEEMQATNEELETLNEEFAATIEELTTTNDEHASRSIELEHRLADRDGTDRVTDRTADAFATLVDSLDIALAAVDAQGAVLVANRLYRTIVAGAGDASVAIDDDAGATIALRVVLRQAGEGRAFRFTYRSIAADQTLSVYAGRARPVPAAGVTRSIIELRESG